MDWIQFFANMIVTGILLYVFQKIIDERSERRLEKFKTELKSIAFESETKFSKLHEIRARVIARLYKNLRQIYRILSTVNLYVGLRNNQQIGDYETNVLGPIQEFADFFNDEGRLYLPEPLCNQIGDFIGTSLRTFQSLVSADINKSQVSSQETGANKYTARYQKDLLEASAFLSERMTPLMVEIEKEFRRLLGS